MKSTTTRIKELNHVITNLGEAQTRFEAHRKGFIPDLQYDLDRIILGIRKMSLFFTPTPLNVVAHDSCKLLKSN